MRRSSRKFWLRLGAVLTGAWVLASGLYWTRKLSFCGLDNPFECLGFMISPKDWTGYLYVIAHWLGFGSLGIAGNALAWIVLVPILVWICALTSYVAVKWVVAAYPREIAE